MQRKVDYEPQVEFVTVNGDPGVRTTDPDGAVVAVLALEVADDRRGQRARRHQPAQAHAG